MENKYASYERIKAFLPKQYKINGQLWKLHGLNERFRFCKYTENQQFNIHHDKKLASFYTVNIYLNDGNKEYIGGKTIFYNETKQAKYKQSSFVIGHPQKYKHSGERVV